MKRLINRAQCEKLICDIRAFRDTASLIERNIDNLELRPVVAADYSTMSWHSSGHEGFFRWMSLTTVSHFNFGVAFELGLKCLILIHGEDPKKHRHSFTKLFGDLSRLAPEIAEGLETVFRVTDPMLIAINPVLIEGSATVEPTNAPESRSIRNLKDFCTYLDGELKLSVQRYIWEDAFTGKPIHYVHRLTVLSDLLDAIENSVKESWAKFNAPTSSTVTWASFVRKRSPPK